MSRFFILGMFVPFLFFSLLEQSAELAVSLLQVLVAILVDAIDSLLPAIVLLTRLLSLSPDLHERVLENSAVSSALHEVLSRSSGSRNENESCGLPLSCSPALHASVLNLLAQLSATHESCRRTIVDANFIPLIASVIILILCF